MRNHQDDITEDEFQGYRSPNYTPVPDELFDRQLPGLSGAELKVLLYIMRRTFGFKKDADDISLNQICRGITTRDGRMLDRGTGLSKSTAQLAIKGLLAKHAVLTTKRVSKEKGNEATTYELNVPTRGPSTENRHRGPVPKIGIALYRKSALQDTEGQETDLDRSKVEGSHDMGRTEAHDERWGGIVTPNVERRGTQAAGDGRDGPMLVGQILQRRAAVGAGDLENLRLRGEGPRGEGATRYRRSRSGVDPEERERLRAFLSDFASELGDEAPLSSTITRALTIFRAANAPPEQWSDLLYQARGRTQEHAAGIRKTAVNTGSGIRRKNKMPYFFATLEQLAGLRPEPTPSRQGRDR